MGFLSTVVTRNPALLIIWLIFLTLDAGLIMNISITAWIIYAIILLFTGGIIVLFTYIVTLVFSLKVTFLNSSAIVVRLWGALLVLIRNYSYLNTQEVLISNFYLLSRMAVLVLIGGYLLLVLLAVVKLAVGLGGPLKSFFTNES